METIKFKTNIKCSGCVAKVSPYLNQAPGIHAWEVDTANSSKILTVSGEINPAHILSAIHAAGFKAEKL